MKKKINKVARDRRVETARKRALRLFEENKALRGRIAELNKEIDLYKQNKELFEQDRERLKEAIDEVKSIKDEYKSVLYDAREIQKRYKTEVKQLLKTQRRHKRR